MTRGRAEEGVSRRVGGLAAHARLEGAPLRAEGVRVERRHLAAEEARLLAAAQHGQEAVVGVDVAVLWRYTSASWRHVVLSLFYIIVFYVLITYYLSKSKNSS